MNYEPLHNILSEPMLFSLVTGVFIGLLLIGLSGLTLCILAGFNLYRLGLKNKPTADKWSKSDAKKIAGFFLLTGAGIFLFIFCGSEFTKQNNLMMQNESIAAENLKIKYSLNHIDWDAEQTKASAFAKTPQDLLVEDAEGRKVVFKYNVNSETGEPILSDLEEPIRSGTMHITVDSIRNR